MKRFVPFEVRAKGRCPKNAVLIPTRLHATETKRLKPYQLDLYILVNFVNTALENPSRPRPVDGQRPSFQLEMGRRKINASQTQASSSPPSSSATRAQTQATERRAQMSRAC